MTAAASTTSSRTARGRSTADRKGSSPQERADAVAVLHQQVSDGVAGLVEGPAWRAMLDTAARFHCYSLGNLLLIAGQEPTATWVAGFRVWQGLGRQVRRGERGIGILAPCTYRTPAADPAGTTATPSPAGVVAAAGAPQDRAAGDRSREVRGFRRVHVFDVAQTDGDPLPDVAPVLLTGGAPAGLWEALAAQVTTHGYSLERGDCGQANGWCDPATRTVRIRSDVDEAQACKTLAHELGHLQCGHVTDLPSYRVCRGRWEVEAESVAYIVAATAGLDTAGYSFAYLAHWAGGDLAVVRAAADTVVRAARVICAPLTATDATTDTTTGDTGDDGPTGVSG
jgi:antirestriction protein ArdC